MSPAQSPGSSHRSPPPVRRAEGYHLWVIFFFCAKLAALALLVKGEYLWAAILFFLPAPWYAHQILQPSARGLGPAITHFRTNSREVWLTIDDGPHPASTPAMLDILDRHQTRATFFLVGKNVEKHPELVSEILLRGHTIGNHTHTHPHASFWIAGSHRTSKEIDLCAAALCKCGVEAKYFRPPVGQKNHALHRQLALRGLELVLWSSRGFDTVCADFKIALARIVAQISPGAIILIHETPANVDRQNKLADALLKHLAREGYRCVIPQDDSLIH